MNHVYKHPHLFHSNVSRKISKTESEYLCVNNLFKLGVIALVVSSCVALVTEWALYTHELIQGVSEINLCFDVKTNIKQVEIKFQYFIIFDNGIRITY